MAAAEEMIVTPKLYLHRLPGRILAGSGTSAKLLTKYNYVDEAVNVFKMY